MTEDGQLTSPPDIEARQQALDISRSFIAQAPAGSGKTELLIQRILALLATVGRPEEILAITFTRKAAGEMKERLLLALERATDTTPPTESHERETWQRAVKALKRDSEKGWNLRINPSRLQIMTIDSFCSSLSRRMPWLTRLGDQPAICDDPARLYRQAAENFLAIVESSRSGQEPVLKLLRHLDNRVDHLRDLLVNMLGRRDQWLRHVVGQINDRRGVLENALGGYVRSVLATTYDVIGEQLISELYDIAQYAARQVEKLDIDSPLHVMIDGRPFDPLDPDHLDKWLALCHLLLTSTGSLRKSVNKNLGFPADKSAEAVARKKQMGQLLAEIAETEIAERIGSLRDLPEIYYSDNQWLILEALIQLLPLVVVELRTVFRQTGTVDFIEVAGAAAAGLGSAEDPSELLLKLDNMISHILVDEFQDTSFSQYELLCKLTSGWEKGDGRSLFIVGDPMQSIYLFREADVGLFLKVCRDGLDDLELTPLSLSANFRSQRQLVDWFNTSFSLLFPCEESDLSGAVRYKEAAATRDHLAGPEVTTHLFNERQDLEEAETVLKLIQQTKEEYPDGTCAILVRSRNHLDEIVKLLNSSGISYQAQDVDPLVNRPVVSDLLALTRAVLSPIDRVAWLAVLRAPWCGLSLADMLQLAAHDKNIAVLEALANLPRQQEMFSVISQDGTSRLNRVIPLLNEARERRGKVSLAWLIESTWQRLGGPACVDEQGIEDAAQFFKALRGQEEGGDLLSISEFSRQLDALFSAPDPQANKEALQIMTIHKAKGLEFDTVILPGLGRGVRGREKQLLQWIEHPDLDLLLAPIPPADGEVDTTYQSIGKILQQRGENETLRLLYVAATRARRRLHLLGHVRNGKEGPAPVKGSLLHAAWSALCRETPVLIESELKEPLKLTPSITRLPINYQVPTPQKRIFTEEALVARASETVISPQEQGALSLRSQEGRIVGTVVHSWMERLALDGISLWKSKSDSQIKARLAAQMSSMGVPHSRREGCTKAAFECLKNVFASSRALWLLGDRNCAECELNISGLVDGKIMHASIDRTFIDEGIRWIVDYKTTRPDKDELLDKFLDREAEKYNPQLSAYVALMSQIDKTHKVRGALYFPSVDAWKEVS